MIYNISYIVLTIRRQIKKNLGNAKSNPGDLMMDGTQLNQFQVPTVSHGCDWASRHDLRNNVLRPTVYLVRKVYRVPEMQGMTTPSCYRELLFIIQAPVEITYSKGSLNYEIINYVRKKLFKKLFKKLLGIYGHISSFPSV